MPKTLLPAAVAIMMLIGTGLASRALTHRLDAPPEFERPLKRELSTFPATIAEWTGTDTSIDDRVIQATDTEDLLSRTYQRSYGTDSVGLYIAYGVRIRDMLPHRPEVCYVASGWTRQAVDTRQLPLDTNEPLDCRILQFARGGFDDRSLIVLNYYIADGEVFTDVDQLRSRGLTRMSGFSYLIQVQIVCSTTQFRTREDSQSLVEAFAIASFPALQDMLPDDSTAATTHTDPE
jgi:EpsI family protein